jgi:hypothetical protein
MRLNSLDLACIHIMDTRACHKNIIKLWKFSNFHVLTNIHPSRTYLETLNLVQVISAVDCWAFHLMDQQVTSQNHSHLRHKICPSSFPNILTGINPTREGSLCLKKPLFRVYSPQDDVQDIGEDKGVTRMATFLFSPPFFDGGRFFLYFGVSIMWPPPMESHRGVCIVGFRSYSTCGCWNGGSRTLRWLGASTLPSLTGHAMGPIVGSGWIHMLSLVAKSLFFFKTLTWQKSKVPNLVQKVLKCQIINENMFSYFAEL